MFVRNVARLSGTARHVDWGNGDSVRLLTRDDGMGYSVCYTTVRANTEALLEYRHHLEACYCLEGSGQVEDSDGVVFEIRPGDLYVLDKHDRHYLRGGADEDLVLLSIFNPPLRGDEVHNLSGNTVSSY
jgi:L-ectoine synthase